MGVAAQPLTWDDIRDWPYDPARRFELVDGELIVSPSPVSGHQICIARLVSILVQHVEGGRLGTVIPGPMDVVLGPETVFQPDILFIADARSRIIERTHIAGPPDLCVEVISEGNRTHDTVVKFHDYAKFGVAEYWLLDQRDGENSSWREVDGCYELIGRARAGQRLPSFILPDLHLDPTRVFSGLPD